MNAGLCELAAAYGYHISENQPFVDGKKRTAHAAMDKFLKFNGLDIIATDGEVIEILIAVGTKKITKQDLANWLKKVTRPISPRNQDSNEAEEALLALAQNDPANSAS